jgi:outer membrane biosynthesis protein TonB
MKTAVMVVAAAFCIMVPTTMGMAAAAASDEHVPVVVCHGVPESDNQPLAKYDRLVVDDDSVKLEGHRAHSKDVIGEPGDEDFQCPIVVVPTPTPTPPPTEATPSPTPTTEEPTVSPTPTQSETPTETPEPSVTPTPTVTPTASVSPSPSSTATPVATPGPTSPPAEHLAKTGVDVGLLIGSAIFALLIGALMFAAARLKD